MKALLELGGKYFKFVRVEERDTGCERCALRKHSICAVCLDHKPCAYLRDRLAGVGTDERYHWIFKEVECGR